MRWIAWLVVIVACAQGTGTPSRSPGAGAPPADASRASSTTPTEHECDALFEHAIAIRIAEQRQSLPPEQLPTVADQAALRSELRAGFLAECRASTRESYRCAMATTTITELGACQPSLDAK